MTTTTLPALLANIAATLRYTAAQARRERRRRESERVCRETQAAGETALAEQTAAEREESR